jgi:hypothetical protein
MKAVVITAEPGVQLNGKVTDEEWVKLKDTLLAASTDPETPFAYYEGIGGAEHIVRVKSIVTVVANPADHIVGAGASKGRA